MRSITKKKPEDIVLRDIPRIAWHYICVNWLSLILLVVCVTASTSSMFGLSRLPLWKNWEACSLGFTSLYTLFIYGQGWTKNFFDDVGGKSTALVCVAILFLLICSVLSLSEYLPFLTFKIPRRWSMLTLVITALFFVIIDFILFKRLAEKRPEVSKAFLLSMKFSDIPILFAFVCLTIYAFILGQERIDKLSIDAFFGGTIAFQMILSNLIWTLTDDIFIENTVSTSDTMNQNDNATV